MAESFFGRKRKNVKPTIETKDLIRLVHERPCLWDRNLTEYRDRSEKEKAWMEIYKVVEPDFEHFSEEMKNSIGSQITKKWYNVRDSYVKSRKNSDRRNRRSYIYTEHLSFLDSALQQDEGEFEETRPADRNFENIEEHWLNDVLVVDDDASQSQHQEPKKASDKSQDNVISLLANLIRREEDDDRAFFKSLIPTVKSLTDETKFEFRIQVMALLKSLASKEKKLHVKKEMVQSDSDDN